METPEVPWELSHEAAAPPNETARERRDGQSTMEALRDNARRGPDDPLHLPALKETARPRHVPGERGEQIRVDAYWKKFVNSLEANPKVPEGVVRLLRTSFENGHQLPPPHEQIHRQRLGAGGLLTHEAMGGHTLVRHVGRTDSDLVRRARRGNAELNEERAAASTFESVAQAEWAVNAAINQEKDRLQEVLSRKPNTEITVDLGTTVGRGVNLGESEVQQLHWVKVLLVRDPRAHAGFRVETAYPVEEQQEKKSRRKQSRQTRQSNKRTSK